MQRSMSIINVTSPSAILPRHRRNNTLILKHEILSEECDMFRAGLPRRLYMSRLLKLMGLVVMFVIVHYAMDVNRIEYSIGMVILLFLAVFIILFQTIEGKNLSYSCFIISLRTNFIYKRVGYSIHKIKWALPGNL